MHLDQILEARALTTPVPQNITADDQLAAIVIQYVPNLGTGGASASFTLANDSFQFLVDSASPAGLDAIGTTGKLSGTDSATDTMGELVDYINGRTAWRAYLVGALRSDTTISCKDKTSTKCSNDNGVTLYYESDDYPKTHGHGFAISGEKFINNGVNGHVTDWDDKCENSLMYGSFLITGDSDDLTLTYYSGKQGSAEVALTAGESVTLATATQHGEENYTAPFIRAKRGERLIGRMSSASDAMGVPTFNIIGETAVLRNDRIVDSDNYGDA